MKDCIQTAFSLAAPTDERYDAQSALQKSYASGIELIPNDVIRPVIDYIEGQYEEQAILTKSARVIPFPGRENKPKGMQSVFLDGLQIFVHGDYFERPSPIGFDTLRSMVEQTPILNAVIMTRIRQVLRFTSPQESDGPGFVIRHVDKEHAPSRSEQDSIRLLSRFMTHCGWEFNPRRRKALKRDNFSQFAAKFVRESLTYDSAPIETELKKNGSGIDGFYALDGSTIRLCSEEGYDGDDKVYAVQVLQGRIATAYTTDDLIYEVRNPRADVRLAGYGLGETELLIRVVTGFLNALTYNLKGFSDNAIPKGILHLVGEYANEDLAAFRRYWNAMVRGVNNAWTLPVMASRDAESKVSFEKLDGEFNEMYFTKWMTFLVSVICSVYGMSPAEINFDSFTAGNTSALAGSDTAEKLAASKDSGLRPLMAHMESLFSDFIVADFSEKYVFRWTGLDATDEQQRFEMQKLVMTVNEARALENLEPLDSPFGDAPINPSLIGPWMQLTQGMGDDDSGGDQGDASDDGGEQSTQPPPQSKEPPQDQEDDQDDANEDQQQFQDHQDKVKDWSKKWLGKSLYQSPTNSLASDLFGDAVPLITDN